MLQSWIGRERASWGKREKKEEAAPIVDRKRKNELEQKREKRGSCSNCGQEEKKQVGAKVAERGKLPNLCTGGREACWGGEVIKQRKMLQVRSGSEKASWGKSSGKGKTPQ